MLGYLFGVLLLIEAALLLLPLLVAIIYREPITPYLVTVAALVAVGLPLRFLKPKKDRRLYAREGFVCAAGSWILLSLFGALPFVVSGAIPNYIDAVFETVSGFTTTGASILTEIEGLPRGILFWRSFTHWVGGMGVLMFMMAILPADNRRSMHLLRAEVPGPQKGKLVPKFRQTALILYSIYLVMTLLQIVALLLVDLDLFDAIVTSLGTAGTGGFSVKNASIAGYENPAAEWIIAVFMLLFGINFNLYFFLLCGQLRDIFKNEELRTYLIIVGAATAVITLNTLSLADNLADTVRAAFFQVSSIISTTGYTTLNYDTWPALSKMVIVILTLLGACAGSTAGGLKVSRFVILAKNSAREIRQTLRPRSVNVTRLDGCVLPEETVRTTSNYLAIYSLILVISSLLISVDGFTLETNLSASLTCLSNVGPGLGAVGPAGNFSGYSAFSKIVLTLEMLIGRLEFFPLLIFFSPSTWKRM